ncbi:MAG: adenylate/guanylate cyclase domain-containing protein [Treponema sp.]|nr:adenylate/guanylate cyclase domain-containing protein [Treponema sp.]
MEKEAMGGRLVFGLFFVSAFMVLIFSVVVNTQMNRHVALMTESIQNHLAAAAQAAAKYISVEELDRYHTVEDTGSGDYRRLKDRLIKFAGEYNVLYVYYWRDYGDGTLQFIVDNDTDPETTVGPGDFYEVEEIAREALSGKVSVTDLGSYTPTWDGLITGSAPVFDGEGNIYCIAGVDISDRFIFVQRRDSRNLMITQICALVISVVFGVVNMVLYRRKADQIAEANTKLQYFNNNLRRAFSTYLSEQVVEEIIADPTRLQLGGIKRRMTALFTDIRDFTKIAEALSPEQLVDLLNDYLSTMSDVILEHKGTIDKYEGDAIISFFGAPLELPDHALQGCVSAIIMKRFERELNRRILAEGRSPSPLLTRIGINTGDMIVGNMGTNRKMNYTIMSNAVNLASRLEGVNKQYGTWILASEDTIKECKGRILARRLNRIRVTGINEAIRIYEVLDLASDAKEELQEKVRVFDRARDLFEDGDWRQSAAVFNHILEKTPHDGPSLLYLKLCQQFLRTPPGKNWNGIFNIHKK